MKRRLSALAFYVQSISVKQAHVFNPMDSEDKSIDA
jgi:hypothetical protein